MSDGEQTGVDRSHFSVATFEEAVDREYWWSLTPQQRLVALERMRRIAYGHDRATGRLRRVLEVVERGSD